MKAKVGILSIIILVRFIEITAQTCCSGGVPLTGNLGMPSAISGTWQISPSYDLNYLNTLKTGSMVEEDASRKRITQSLMLEAAYSISDHISVSTLFTYVFQSRIIDQFGTQNRDFLSGVGDAVMLLTFRTGGRENQKWELLLGAGPKIPLGRTNMTNSDGIAFSADLQPGSGAWDAIVWGLLSRQGAFRPSSNLSLRLIYRNTGVNDDFLGFSSYRFGNELQVITGISDQVLLGRGIFNPSMLIRFRTTGPDLLGGNDLPNTGGYWVYLIPGIVYQSSPGFHARLAVEIPLYSYLQGIQLTTDFRLTAGLYFRIKSKKYSYITN